MFQGLRQNSILYILEKNGVPKLKVGQVVSVSNPMPKFGTLNPQLIKEQERDEKMTAFEKRIEGMESSLNNIVGILKSLKQS